MNLNKVTIAGRLTRDPELRVLPKGTPVCQFGVAVNRTWIGEDKQKKEEVTFLDVEAWGKTAETIAKHFTKGRQIYLEGRIKIDQFDDKTTGQKRSKMKVVVESFQFLGSKGDSQGGERVGQTDERATSTGATSANRTSQPTDNTDEDVPF
jgi:single-strand DNA-binding protein